MPDLEVLRDLTPQFPPPALDDLAAVLRRRRRRAALTAGAGALAAVVVVATLLGGMPRNDRSTDPVDDPTDGRTAENQSWSPDRIRAEGEPLDYLKGRDGAPAARFWTVCDLTDCDYTEARDFYRTRPVHFALEVTDDGYRTSGLFGLNGGGPDEPPHHLQPFDDNSVFVQDWSRQGGTQERYRLLNADGTTTDLTMLPTTAPAAAGPDLVRISAMSAELARVNDTAGTIQRLNLPDAVHSWAEMAADQLLWGVADDCVVYWQQPGGDFTHRDLDCRAEESPGNPVLWIDDEPRAAAWFTAERMAVAEMGGPDYSPVALHVSLDRGATWQRIPVTEDNTMEEVLAQQR